MSTIYSDFNLTNKDKKKESLQPHHYLLSVPVGDGTHVHAYVIATDHNIPLQVTNRMIDQIQSLGHWLVAPVCVQTVLDESGAKQIRAFLSAEFPESRKLLAEAKDFHVSTWGMPDEHPDSDWLLKLH